MKEVSSEVLLREFEKFVERQGSVPKIMNSISKKKTKKKQKQHESWIMAIKLRY